VVLVVLAGGATVALWQAQRAAQEQLRAEAVNDFIAAIFREANPYARGGKPVMALELLRDAERRIAEQQDLQPDARIELQLIVGESLIKLQDTESAARVLGAVAREAGALPGEADPLLVRAWLGLSRAQGFRGEVRAAHSALATTLKRIRIAKPENTELHVEALLQQAAFALDEAKHDDAERAALVAYRAAAEVIGMESAAACSAAQLLGMVYRLKGRSDLALRYSQEAYEIALRVQSDNIIHPDVIDATVGYGRALLGAGQFHRGLEKTRQATRDAIAVFGRDSLMAGHFLAALAVAEVETGAPTDAVQNARRALEILLSHRQPGTVDHASRVRWLGRALLEAGRGEEATSVLNDALTLARQSQDRAGEQSVQVSRAAAIVESGQRLDVANALLTEVLTEGAALAPLTRLCALNQLGTSRRKQGRLGEARAALNEAVQLAGDEGRSRVELAKIMLEQHSTNRALGDTTTAPMALKTAISLLEQPHVPSSPLLAHARAQLGSPQ
jgi:tetratricopeptide (TPR) repeat protein